MESIRDFLGCRCRYKAHGFAKGPTDYTFPWAKNQYREERSVLPIHQSLDLHLDIEKNELSGVTTIDFRAIQRDVIFFKINSVDIRIHDVQLSQTGQWQPTKFSVQERHILISLPFKMNRGDRGQVKIVYSVQKPKAGLYFIKPDGHYKERPTQVWTQGQDDDSQYWFPCFDEPGIKCTYDLKAEVPAGFIATSNGALQSETKGGKTWTFHWKTEFLIPAYLVTLTVGRFSEIKDQWRGKPVTYLVEKGREEEAKISFGKTPKMMEYFSQKTGVEYPYEKYAQIAAAEFIFGGMENTSATTQTDATLHPLEIEENFTSDDLVSHELAHQWFGDLVTCKSWAHGWLNEGWATFMEYVFKEYDMGKEESDYFRYQDLGVYLAEDAEFRRPIVTHFYSDPAEIWDRHTYQKGGLVLQMLKAYMGEEDFWAGTRHYLETHRGGHVETIDFQRALENTSGLNLQKFFDQWIYKAGYPEYKFGVEWDEKAKMAKIQVEQSQSDKDLIFEVKTDIQIVFSNKSTQTISVIVSDKSHTFYIPLSEKPSYALFDKGNHLLKTLEITSSQEMIKAQLENDEDVVGKVWAMKTIAKNASLEGLEALGDRLKRDSFWGVRAEAAEALGSTKSEMARDLLLVAMSEEKNSKVRARVAQALGNFKNERVADVLMHTFEKDKNIFVQGAALVSLGKMEKSKKVRATLLEGVKTSSWRDYVAAQAYSGLSKQHDEENIPLFLEGARYGAPKYARLTAFSGLGEIALNRADVREFLINSLEDPFLRARYSAASALTERREASATQALEGVANRMVDGHFKAMAFRAAKNIRENLSKPQELHDLKTRVDKMVDENRKLQDRLSKLEQTKKGTSQTV